MNYFLLLSLMIGSDDKKKIQLEVLSFTINFLKRCDILIYVLINYYSNLHESVLNIDLHIYAISS